MQGWVGVGEVGVDQYISDLHKQSLKTHELAKDMLRSSQKSMKYDCDLCVRKQKKNNVGDLVYLRCNVGKRLKLYGADP